MEKNGCWIIVAQLEHIVITEIAKSRGVPCPPMDYCLGDRDFHEAVEWHILKLKLEAVARRIPL